MAYAKIQPQGLLCSGELTATILAIFHSPNLRRFHMKFEQIGPEALEKKSFEILNIFPIQMHKEAKLTLP